MKMKSIIRTGDRSKITLKELYSNIEKGKNCPGFYRKVNFLIDGENTVEKKEYLVLESLGKGRMGCVFLAYHRKKLTALKISTQYQEVKDLFSTVKKKIGADYQKYFLSRAGKTIKKNFFYLGETIPANKIFFDGDIYITFWEPADATLSERYDESFEIKLKWFREFLTGLSIIHSRDRAHFDIKLDNLFLVGNQLKIGDFEFYFKIDDFKQSDIFICGTPGHIAPEMFYDRENISPKIDIFSGGVAFARLFTGQRFQGDPGLTGQEEKDLEELFRFTADREILQDEDFRLNFKIFRFYESGIIRQLETGELSGVEKAIYGLLLEMMELDPEVRPGAAVLLEKVNAILNVSNLNQPVIEPTGDEISTLRCVNDSFSRMLHSHDCPEVIRLSLVFRLLKKLKQDKTREKIGAVRFEGNVYKMAGFSFIPLQKEHALHLFGKKILSSDEKYGKIWNEIVIIDYWNRNFELGLEKDAGFHDVEKIFKGGSENMELYDKEIRETKKTIKRILKRL